MKIILIVWGVKQNVAEELFEIVVAIVNMHLKILLILFEIKHQKWHTDIYPRHKIQYQHELTIT